MKNKEKNWIANRCVKAKEKEGIILISDIIEIVDDFNKNRTCENCALALKVDGRDYRECSKWKHIRIKTYGCNDFVSTDTKSPEQD